VYLISRPKVSLEDFFAVGDLDKSYKNGIFSMDVNVRNFNDAAAAGYSVVVGLTDAAGKTVFTKTLGVPSIAAKGEQKVSFKQSVASPKLWSAEYPNLYNLTVTLKDAQGKTAEFTAAKTGFRKIEMKNGQVWINGTPIIIRGTNIHEHHPKTGHTVDQATRIEDIRLMKLKHAVITSVDRDDLPDKGAAHWAETIRAIKSVNPQLTLEVLIPDFDGDTALIDRVIAEKPEIISHNLETVKRLTSQIRTKAKYETSLRVLKHIASRCATAKTGIMLGLGETEAEVLELMDDALATGSSVLTIGQYMQPSRKNIAVSEYIHPDKFAEYKAVGLEKGFRIVESAPLVRSSYCAEKHLV
jgi:lipoate synthase